MYKDQTVQSRSSLKRFSHGRRFNAALKLLDLSEGDRILDFGAGDGYMLRLICLQAVRCDLIAYEPTPVTYAQLAEMLKEQICAGLVSVTNNLNEIPRKHFDKILCLEVLEHLPEDYQRAALQAMRHCLKDEGLAVVSVPIEVGISSLAKNIVRMALGERHEGTSAENLVKALFSVPIKRQPGPYILSHVGFNYKNLERQIQAEGFRIIRKTFSPLRMLAGILNSQVLYVIAVQNAQGVGHDAQ